MDPVRKTYDEIGIGYAATRQADPRIAAHVGRALGDASSLVNVGAGSGSYEPVDRRVFAVEPAGFSEGAFCPLPDHAGAAPAETETASAEPA